MSQHEPGRHAEQVSPLVPSDAAVRQLTHGFDEAQKDNGSERGERSKPLRKLGRRRPRRRGGHQGRRLRGLIGARGVPEETSQAIEQLATMRRQRCFISETTRAHSKRSRHRKSDVALHKRTSEPNAAREPILAG